MNRMPPTSISNLNAKLPARPGSEQRPEGIGISWSKSAIHSSAPPVRIVGAGRRYQGGYRVNV
jgi:hypothetical protein